MSRNTYISLALLSFFILWPTVQGFILHVDGAGRSLFIVSLLSFVLLGKSLINVFKTYKSLIFVLLFMVYAIVNGMMKGTSLNFWELMRVVYPIVPMSITINVYRRDPKLTLRCLSYAMTLQCLLIMLFDSYSVALGDRFGETFNAVDLGIRATSAVAVSFLYFSLWKKDSEIIRVLLLLIPSALVVLTASRISFAVLILMFVAYYGTGSGKGYRFVVKLIAFCLIACVSYLILSKTILGERFLSTTHQVSDSSVATGTPLDLFGDRGAQYYLAFPYIKSNLLTGIGYANWRATGPLDLVFHSEYLVQLCENGLLSFIWFLSFIVLLFRKVFSLKSCPGILYPKQLAVLKFFLFSMLITDAVIWTNDRFDYYIIFGLIYAMCDWKPKAVMLNVKID